MAISKDMSDLEKLAAEVHDVYTKELARQGKQPRWPEDYNALPEDIKDLDRAIVRWHLARL